MLIRSVKVWYSGETRPRAFFLEFVDFVSERRTVYQTPADIPCASIGPAQRLASLGLDSMAQVRQLFSKPSCNTVAAVQGLHAPRNQM